MSDNMFSERGDAEQVEMGTRLAPMFDDNGLIPCITTDAKTGEVLMFAWMNREALSRTLENGVATYYSRSREKIWVKGESSGRIQNVQSILVDCDQDVIQLRVEMPKPGACHRGYRSCFYREISDRETGKLSFVEDEPVFDPERVYPKSNS
ncbi:MAG: phosphoribosyl-AMP cyclohydrolase [Balneolaceae bacterium]